MGSNDLAPRGGDILIYQTEGGQTKMHMQDWIAKLNGFLKLNDRQILTSAGKISHELAKQLAESEYDKFHTKRVEWKDRQDSDFDKTVKRIEEKKREKKPRLKGSKKDKKAGD